MAPSIDISNYEKAAMLEDYRNEEDASSSSSVEGDNTTALLDTHVSNSRPAGAARWIRSPWLFLVDLCLVALALIFYSARTGRVLPGTQGDVTGFVPEFSQQTTIFRSHPEFISNHSSLESLKEAQEAWMQFLPRGQGYLRINEGDLKKYELPEPVEYRGGKSLGTSWMHGMHCLYLIMSEYDMLALGMRKPGAEHWHFDHCLDYVRQLIICSGDMALAGGDLPGGSSFLDVPHVCKNYDQMYEYLEARRDNDAYQFGTEHTHFVPP